MPWSERPFGCLFLIESAPFRLAAGGGKVNWNDLLLPGSPGLGQPSPP